MKIPLFILALASSALAQDAATPATPAAAPAATPAPKKPAPRVQQSDTPIPPPPVTASAPRVLLVGGGDSHDFQKWFNEVDRPIFADLKPAYLEYTDNPGGLPAVIANVDLLVWSANLPVTPEIIKAVKDYVAAGKSLLVLHAGAWYSWKNFPEWNREILGGGASKHNRFGDFSVEVTDPSHPIMAGLPAKFQVSDELYNSHTEPGGAPMKVLAQAVDPKSGATYPSIWVAEQPKAKIVCICIGHDGKVHNLPEYRTLLNNSYHWLTGK